MRKYLVLLALSVAGLLIRFYVSGHGIFGDGNAYFAYAHALYFEHGLQFDGIYQHLSHFQGKKYTFSRVFWGTDRGPLGVQHNPWTIGTGLFWVPALALTDGAARLIGQPLGEFDLRYEFGIGLIGILYTLVGLWWLERYLSRWVDRMIASWTIISLYAATNLLYYLSLEPALSHQIVFFLVSGLLWFTRKPLRHWYQILLVGLAMGLLAITRMADVLLLVPIGYQLLTYSLATGSWRERIPRLGWLGMGISIGILPQLGTQYAMFGTIWQNPYFTGENGHFVFSLPGLWNALFSVHRGLLSWTPFLWVGIIGLIQRARQPDGHFCRIILATLGVFWIAVAGWSGIDSAGFGSRLFVGSLPYFAVGIAVCLVALAQRQRSWLLAIGIIFNLLVLQQFALDPNRMVKDQGLTYQNFFTGMITTPYKIYFR